MVGDYLVLTGGAETYTPRVMRAVAMCLVAIGCSFDPGKVAPADAVVEPPDAPPTTCAEVGQSGIYTITIAGQPTPVFCEHTLAGGDWTLIGSFVNSDGARQWTLASLQSAEPTFGALETRESMDYKSAAYGNQTGTDLLVVTDEYAFSFHALFARQTFASFMTSSWPTACSVVWLRQGASFTQGLSQQQASTLGVSVRAFDTNDNACFPGGQGTALSFLVGPLHTNGLGNAPLAQVAWASLDMSLPNLASFGVAGCAPGYPCNSAGLEKTWDDYGASVKAQRALLFIR